MRPPSTAAIVTVCVTYCALMVCDGSSPSTAGPDFIVAGCMKCGTTQIAKVLSKHPQMQWAQRELFYLDSRQCGPMMFPSPNDCMPQQNGGFGTHSGWNWLANGTRVPAAMQPSGCHRNSHGRQLGGAVVASTGDGRDDDADVGVGNADGERVDDDADADTGTAGAVRALGASKADPVVVGHHVFTHGVNFSTSVVPTCSAKNWAKLLPKPKAGLLTFDKSPAYMFLPQMAQRLQAIKPDTKVIFVLRDPVVRAVSHYGQDVRQDLDACVRTHINGEPVYRPRSDGSAIGAKMVRAFDELVRIEIAEIRGDCGPTLAAGYDSKSLVRMGLYAEQLQRYYDRLPEEQILVLISEDLWADARKYDQVDQFLGLTSPLSEAAAKLTKIANKGTHVGGNHADLRALQEFYQPYNQQLCELLKAHGHKTCPPWTTYK